MAPILTSHKSLHTLTISHIAQVTPTIRLFRLTVPPDNDITFLPGQWLDLHPPAHTGIAKPGGFTITSPPSLAAAASPANPAPYLELAVQSSPQNPAAAYLFLPAAQLLGTPVQVRIGGSFVFPPRPAEGSALRKVVFVAGGMGINPLMSMLSFIGEQQDERGRGGLEVRVLYSVRDPGVGGGGILFLERIAGLLGSGRLRGGLRLFLTGGQQPSASTDEAVRDAVVRCDAGDVPALRRRMTLGDVEEALGGDKESAAVYVCGVPAMTDEFVEALISPEGLGMEESRVLFEKWW